MNAFAAGYSFFEKNSGSYTAASIGGSYVALVESEITKLISDLNSFQGYETKVKALKGDIAEFWHSDTFNIDAVARGSTSRTYVDRSHGFASADITSNFGKEYGLKYYKTGADSAKQQSKSILERFNEYRGNDTLEEYLSKRGYSGIESILNDPIYSGQERIIPKEQMEEAITWLKRKIQEESAKRPEQVRRYQETLEMLRDRIEDDNGTSSIPLSKDEAETLASLAKEGLVSEDILEDLGISTEEIIQYQYILQEAFKAGTTAATISIVLKVAPEIYKAISYLIQNRKLDEHQFQKIGFAALQGGAEGFVRGSISAAITSACKAGLWGEALKNVEPSIVASVTVITMDTMKNAFSVAIGKMESRELASELIREMFISTCSLIGSGISQALIDLPVVGFMLGSFIGSVVGSFAYNVGCNAILSFCVDTGFTMFGLVDQNYTLPMEVLEKIGVDVFQYEKFTFDKFQYDKFTFEKFTYRKLQYETLGIGILRRGVIGVSQIGYV